MRGVQLSSETDAGPQWRDPATAAILRAPYPPPLPPPRISARPSRKNQRIPSRHRSSSTSEAPFSSRATSMKSRAVRFAALTLDRLQKLKYQRIVTPKDFLLSSSNPDSSNRSGHCGNQNDSLSYAFVGMQRVAHMTDLPAIPNQPISLKFERMCCQTPTLSGIGKSDSLTNAQLRGLILARNMRNSVTYY